jgi:UDP-glucose 4-epimerase
MAYEMRDRGENVVVLDNLSTGHAWVLPENVPLVVGDIGDEKLTAETIRTYDVDTILHFAASIVVPESVADPLSYYRNNTANSRSLIEMAVRGGVKQFIFSSTAAVYGEPETIPVPEDARLNPTSPYGSSKLMTEIMLRDVAAATGLRYVILRYFNVTGADPKLRTGEATPAPTHLIKVAVQVALGVRPHLSLYGHDYPTPDGTCIRDYIHVTDLVKAHSAALDYLRQGGKSTAMNCGYGHGYSVRQVVQAVKELSGVDFAVQQSERRPGDPACLVADVERIKRTLRWEPEFDHLPTMVEHMMAWERKLVAHEADALSNRPS